MPRNSTMAASGTRVKSSRPLISQPVDAYFGFGAPRYMRWSAHSMYPAVSTTALAATTVRAGYTRHHRKAGIHPPRPEQHEHLGDEGRQARDAHGGEEREARDAGVERHDRRQAAEPVDVAVVGAVVDDADQEEEHRRDRAVVEHL